MAAEGSPDETSAVHPAMSRPPGALPPQLSPAAAAEALGRAARFLERALALCRAQAVELYTRGLWDRLVAPPPAAVLRALRAAGPLAPRRSLAEAAGAAAWGESGRSWGGRARREAPLRNLHRGGAEGGAAARRWARQWVSLVGRFWWHPFFLARCPPVCDQNYCPCFNKTGEFPPTPPSRFLFPTASPAAFLPPVPSCWAI